MSGEEIEKVKSEKAENKNSEVEDKKISAEKKNSVASEEKNSKTDEKKSDAEKNFEVEKKISETDDKKISEKNKSDSEEEKNSDAEEKNSDKKNSDSEKKVSDKKNSDSEKKVSDKKNVLIISEIEEKKSDSDKIISSLNEKNWSEKISQPFETLREMFEDISLKYIAAVAGGVFFCIFIVGAVLIFADGSPQNFSQKNSEDVSEEKRIHIKIHEGMTSGEIADELAAKNVISNSLKFRFLSRIRGYDDKMKPGTYVLTQGMEDDEVFEKILNGEKQEITFTIPEGFGVKDIAKRLYGLDIADEEDFTKAAENFAPYDYMKKRKNVFYAAEGFLFPDTYTIESDASVEDILKMMTANFDNRLTPSIREQAKEKNLSIYDLIILASLVEKEVRYPEDRAIVAQVFFKRLKLNMPLQTDASLQYLMNAPKEDVSIEDTKIESPYNTYIYSGLPPGPVANPGMEAIEAVLNPADTDYLYFVADRRGHNHYADTYEEHLELVAQYR